MESIGDRIRSWRRRRNRMSQKTLADLAGLSQSYLSEIESGKKPLDRKNTQVAIASALNISVAQLVGQSGDPDDPVRARAEAHLPGIRSTLVELIAGERRQPRRGLDVLGDEVQRATAARMTTDYATLAAIVPDLVLDLAGHGPAAAPGLVESLFCTRALLKAIGQPDLARETAALGVECAREGDDVAWLGQAIYSWVVAFPPENSALGMRIAAKAANEMQGATGAGVDETYAMLHLMCALQSAIAARADDAWAHLGEAADVAMRLGQPQMYGPRMAGFNSQWCGPVNTEIWRVALAAELGDTGMAVDVSTRIQLGELPVPNRLVYYWLDLARALAGDGGKDQEAMQALAQAERVAPQHFRFNATVRDMLNTLIGRAKRRAVGAEIVALAHKLGLDPI